MKFNVLVFPCGSEIGLEIHNALKWSTHVELFGASSVSDHGKFVYKNYTGGLPHVDENNFIEELNKIIDNFGIDFIMPAHDSVVFRLANESNKVHCKIAGSPRETCIICRSKKKTYDFFNGVIKIPRVYNSNLLDAEFPLFLKPDVGQGSRGTFVANSKEEVIFYLERNKNMLTLEYLPGNEYTVDCFTNMDGKLLFCGPRKRNRVTNGISVNTNNIENKRFDKIANVINAKIAFIGAWFFQVKEDKKNELTLMEIAPRIAGSMALYRNLGINFPLLTIFASSGMSVEIMKNNYDIEMDRALISRFELSIDYKHVYIDLDDTIIFKEKINTLMISFLYQCRNKNIKIHLITRHEHKHKTKVENILEKYKISEIFDNVINVEEGKEKKDLIDNKDAIFIDDSFSERKKVFKKLKIPTFDPNSIESLIDPKI